MWSCKCLVIYRLGSHFSFYLWWYISELEVWNLDTMSGPWTICVVWGPRATPEILVCPGYHSCSVQWHCHWFSHEQGTQSSSWIFIWVLHLYSWIFLYVAQEGRHILYLLPPFNQIYCVVVYMSVDLIFHLKMRKKTSILSVVYKESC